jgi:hypothetical protein
MNAPLDKSILRLGYGGLVPFVGLAALLWTVPAHLQGVIGLSLLAYGALIASFLGGIHWGTGFLMGDAAPRAQFVWGIVPSLLAWLALMLPPRSGLVMLAVVLLACLVADRMTYPALGLGRWLPMRLQLTVVAVASCVLGALRLWIS